MAGTLAEYVETNSIPVVAAAPSRWPCSATVLTAHFVRVARGLLHVLIQMGKWINGCGVAEELSQAAMGIREGYVQLQKIVPASKVSANLMIVLFKTIQVALLVAQRSSGIRPIDKRPHGRLLRAKIAAGTIKPGLAVA